MANKKKGYTLKVINGGVYKVYDGGKAREYLGRADNKKQPKKGESIASQIGFKKGGRIKCSHNRLY